MENNDLNPIKLSTTQTAVPLWQTPIALISLALTVFILLYSDSMLSLINFWWDSGSYSHGILVLPITIYLIWLKREPLTNSEATPLPWGALLLLILSLAWLGAKTTNIQTIERLALIALFPTLIWTLLGNSTAKIILFPLTYPFFASPLWDFAAIPLQNMTALASYKILQLTSLPILLEEHYISIPAGVFLIEKACGGLRFFITAGAISSLYAYLNLRSLSRQVMFVTIALLGAVILNWVRVCIIIWLGQLTNMEHPLVHDHVNLGWWLFAGGMIPLFYFGSKISKPKTADTSPITKPTQVTKKNALFIFTVISVLVLTVAPLSLYLTENNSQQSEKWHISPPDIPPPWAAVLQKSSNWKPEFKGADSQITSSYHMKNNIAHLHISYYSKQTQGAELINELNTIYDNNSWRKTEKSVRQLHLKNGELLQVKEIQLVNSNQHTRLIWFWYRVADRNTINPITAKLLELWKLIINSPGSAVVALAIDYDDSPDAARARLKDFSLGAYPAIEVSLQRQ